LAAQNTGGSQTAWARSAVVSAFRSPKTGLQVNADMAFYLVANVVPVLVNGRSDVGISVLGPAVLVRIARGDNDRVAILGTHGPKVHAEQVEHRIFRDLTYRGIVAGRLMANSDHCVVCQ